MVFSSDRPNPVSAEPNRTKLFFCRTIVQPTELCSAKTSERVRQMGHISAERSVRFGFCRTCLRFGRSLVFSSSCYVLSHYTDFVSVCCISVLVHWKLSVKKALHIVSCFY